MGTRRLTRWVRVGLVAIALAGLTAVPMIDSASAALPYQPRVLVPALLVGIRTARMGVV